MLILGWILWCTLHSLLITGRINELIVEKGGLLQGTYRLIYSLFSALSLLPLLWYQYSLPQQIIFSWAGWLRLPQGILLAYALAMLYGGNKVYDIDQPRWHPTIAKLSPGRGNLYPAFHLSRGFGLCAPSLVQQWPAYSLDRRTDH